MYPDLSYLFNEIFKTPIDNPISVFKIYGVSLALTFGICSILLKQEFKRREGILQFYKQKVLSVYIENVFISILSTLIGYKLIHIVLNLQGFKLNPRDMILSWHGNILGGLIFLFCAIFIIYYSQEPLNQNLKKTIYFYKLTPHLSVVVITFALIGTKILGICEVDFSEKTFYQIFNESGTNFLGGLLGGIIGGFLFCRLFKVPFYHLLDTIAPIMMLGYSLGRLGCHISGDGCWGIENSFSKPNWFLLPDWLWAYNYPHNVVDKGTTMFNSAVKHNKVLEIPVFPTPLYEALFGLIMFSLFWRYRKKITRPYFLFIFFVLSIGIERFFIEFIRINKKYNFLDFHLSQAQFISLGMILFSIVFLVKNYYYKYETIQS